MFKRLVKFFADILNSLKSEGSFIQNFTFVAGGKIFLSIISFIVVPVLSRLYPPEAYGYFALFTSISSIGVTLILMGYPAGYVLIRMKSHLKNLMVLQVMVVFVISLITGIVILSLNHFALLGDKSMIWFYIPLGILTSGIMTIFSSWNVREKQFKLAALLEGFGGTFLKLVNVLIGWLGKGYSYGLIIGDLIGKNLGNLIIFKRFWSLERDQFREGIKWSVMLEACRLYKRYPRFVLPNQLLNQLGGQLPIYLMAIAYDSTSVGYYGMATTLFALPTQLLVNALAPVYLQKANELVQEGGSSLQKFSIRLLKITHLILLAPLAILMNFSDEIITFFLGENWKMTASLVFLMGFSAFIQITVSPLQSIFQIYKREKIIFFINFYSLIGLGIVLSSGIFLNVKLITFVLLLVLIRLISVGFSALWITRILKISFWKNVLRYYTLFLLFVFFLYSLKEFFN